MAPPDPRIPTSSVSRSAPESRDDFGEWFRVERLLHDPSHAEDATHLARRWREDSEFRNDPLHQRLYLALDALQVYARQTPVAIRPGEQRTLSAWSEHARSATATELDRLALQNLTLALSELGTEHAERVGVLRETLHLESPEPEAEPEAPAASAESASGFGLTALTAGLRLDRPQREFVSDLLLGALPDRNIPGYNQTADFGMELGAEFRWGDFRLFGNIAWNHGVVPEGAPAAHFEQAFLQFGLLEYGGDRRAVGADRVWLGSGRSRVGMGIGFRACTHLNEAEAAAGAECSDSSAQLSLVGDSDLVSLGYGPVEFSVRLISSPYYFNLSDDSHVPSFNNLVPLEFSLMYHFDHPESRVAPGASRLEGPIRDSEAVYDALRVVTTGFQDHLSFRSESALEMTRALIAQGVFGGMGAADGQFNLTNLGSFFGGVLRGWNAGSLAYDLRADLAHGNDGQRAVLGAALAVEPLIHGAAFLANPRERPEVPSLEENAFYLALPHLLLRDGLSILGAVGFFGNRNAALRGEGLAPYHWLGAHGALALGGLVMILLSGDGSGGEFLSNSVLGNVRPDMRGAGVDEVNGYLDSQRWQYFRLTGGTMLLGYGARGILDFIFNGGRFSPETPEPAEVTEESTGSESESAALEPTFGLGLDTDARTRGVVTVGGTF